MPKQISINWIRFFGVLVLVFCVFIFARLYYLQIIKNEDFKSLSDNSYYNTYSKNIDRGSIIFKYADGRDFFAATNKTGYTLEINPQIIKNPEDTYNILSNFIELDVDEYFKKATKENDRSEVLAERIDIETAEKIKDLDLQGVILSKEKWRFYPGKNLASQVIGFQSYKGDEIKGRYGLERYYDDTLSVKNTGLFKNFFVEIFSEIEKTITDSRSEGNLVTTLEPNIQTYSEEVVQKIQNDWSSKKTGAIIMDPNTGAIRAMALYPNFDINIFNEEETVSIFNNDSVESIYEMGSIFKPITVAIGLDKNIITPETTYEDKGSLTLDQKTIWNYDKKARGVVDMQEVLNQSLNTGAAYVALKVGNEEFSKYMKKLIGEKTGIDLPNEVSSIISNLDSKRDVEHATASYGHGIAVTPIQMIRSLAPLGNGGYMPSPHIVSEIKYEFGLKNKVEPKDKVQIFEKETSEEITRMLVKVVDDALAGGTVALPNHSIAAKTGTALIPDSTNGGYYDDRFLHSFFGYFPAYDPEFIILLYTIEPKGALYASNTLTEPFMDIVKYLINYYGIEPDR